MHEVLANKVAAFGTILSDRLTSALAPLSPSAASILLTLSCWGALTATKLAAIVGVTQPTAVRVIAGLTAAGLVRKTASAQRTVPFLLTALGIGQFLRFYQRFRKHLHAVELFSGALLLFVGGLVFVNRLTWMAGKLGFLNSIVLWLERSLTGAK